MISPLALAQACADAYADAPAGFDHIWEFSGTHAAHRRVEGADIIVFRGSKDAEDWIRDLEAVPIWDSRLGFVHAGFMMGMYDVLAAVALAAVKDIVVTGHSLGGARARILAALLAYSGKPVSQCCVFGSPRPGFANLSRILQKSATPLASYRNYHDPVPLVPAAWVPVIGDPWVHPDPWISLEEHSAPDDLEPLRDHHIQRYLDGLAKLG